MNGSVSSNGQYFKVPFKQFAEDRTVNVAYLGVLANLLGLDDTMVFQSLEDYFGAKKPEVTEKNRTIFSQAFDWAESQHLPEKVKLAPVADRQERLMLNGNEAIALGAISAGLKILFLLSHDSIHFNSFDVAGLGGCHGIGGGTGRR